MKAATGRPHGNEKILENERGNTRSHSAENSLWKRLWTCLKEHYVMVVIATHNMQMCPQAA
jgi:hypothetical protein